MKKCFFCLAYVIALLIILSACKEPAPNIAHQPQTPIPEAAGAVISSAPVDLPEDIARSAGSEPAPSAMPKAELLPAYESPVPAADVLKAPASPDPIVKDTAAHPPQEAVNVYQPADIPVLYYHSISDKPVGISILSVTTGDFEKQMKHLRDNGYTSIFLNEDPSLYRKPVIVTLDDGYVDNYLYAYPILEKYNIKATIFVVTDFIGAAGYLTADQIKSMQRLVSFQSHTVSHSSLDELGEDQLLHELKASKEILTRLTGETVYALCYPYGDYNSRVVELASRYYTCGMTIREGIETKILDNYRIKRLFVSRNDTLQDFIGLLAG